MDINEFDEKSDELVRKIRETTDPAEKAALNREWWNAAKNVFNTEISGEVKLADGRTATIPEI